MAISGSRRLNALAPLSPKLTAGAQGLKRRRAEQAGRGEPAGAGHQRGAAEQRGERQPVIDRHLELEHPLRQELADGDRAERGDQPGETAVASRCSAAKENVSTAVPFS